MADVRDVEMDDMDLDLTIDPEMETLEEEHVPATTAAQQDATTTGDAGDKNGDGPTEEQRQPAPMKVYIHGVDEFTTEDVRAYSVEHFPAGDFEKVEWIDDSSAKLVFGSVGAVALALEAFIDAENPNPRDSPFGPTYTAKRSANKPYAEIRVRAAALGDVKKARAHEASRFYLMNPEHDPRTRRQQYDSRRGRATNERGDYNRRRFDDREQRRRQEGGAFDVSMYDDDAGEGEAAVSEAGSRDGRHERRRGGRRRSAEDLFGAAERGRQGLRLRDRSASPPGEGDGRNGFGDEQPARRTARQRSTTPPRLRRDLEREYGRANVGKELFPMKSPKELFPNRSSVSIHRRTPAFDAADETETPPKSRSLADRITGGPEGGSSRGSARRAGRDGRGDEAGEEDDDVVGFRGAASASNFSIRGAAAAGADGGAAVRELFPLKTGTNAGKELFGEKIRGRGGARRRAEDMF